MDWSRRKAVAASHRATVVDCGDPSRAHDTTLSNTDASLILIPRWLRNWLGLRMPWTSLARTGLKVGTWEINGPEASHRRQLGLGDPALGGVTIRAWPSVKFLPLPRRSRGRLSAVLGC